MKNFFRELISDDNKINERSFVGVLAFAMMILAFIVDIVTGIFGKKLVIEEFIFDGFLVLTSVAFGLTVAHKIFNKEDGSDKPE
jgi:hypothetical protein